ncbi:arsenical pump-driving ATPase [Parendozoicomonas haliclonae]|uniref:Arsenical pump-driving ATPase n=1 Tax=Parendozoicomonas haliclonae TaxID=1960125 RepID=A0A1X7ARJ1_9GAMM|nr:arsenical pump-driving ATPase [Parendozoicomonas haliclonae]SMA50719.1 Arsenical pump-driving ATPase [Parendozoicomonas haliclonae]
MNFLDNAPRILFFTGKGGVGKTSTACASAVYLAGRGEKVLLVSTDPASNIDEVLATPLSGEPTAIRDVENLFALNIDPRAAAAAYRARAIDPYRGILPDAVLENMEEQLSGACTLEIAAFDGFTELLVGNEKTADFDRIIFDTAPTGHTLRLLSLPKAWTGFVADSTTGSSCLGPLAALEKQTRMYAQAVETLADESQTRLVLVTRPEAASIKEASRTSEELAALGITNQHLVVNGQFVATDLTDPVAVALASRAETALSAMPENLRQLALTTIPLAPVLPVGLEGLRRFFAPQIDTSITQVAAIDSVQGDELEQFIEELAASGRGAVMTMGKGGVGKTSIAAMIARRLAEKGHPVTLTTTDPAAHVADAAGQVPAHLLRVERIDPVVEIERYRKEVLSEATELDDDGRALLEEDLRSPCIEEIAVFQAFARTVHQADDRITVIDTAPTGHTILLLDAAQSYHKEVLKRGDAHSDEVTGLLPRLRDPAFTRLLICTLPEATPVHEAADLQEDLKRAGITPAGWVVNQCLQPLAVTDPLLVARRAREAVYLREVADTHASRVFILPWQER